MTARKYIGRLFGVLFFGLFSIMSIINGNTLIYVLKLFKFTQIDLWSFYHLSTESILYGLPMIFNNILFIISVPVFIVYVIIAKKRFALLTSILMTISFNFVLIACLIYNTSYGVQAAFIITFVFALIGIILYLLSIVLALVDCKNCEKSTMRKVSIAAFIISSICLTLYTLKPLLENALFSTWTYDEYISENAYETTQYLLLSVITISLETLNFLGSVLTLIFIVVELVYLMNKTKEDFNGRKQFLAYGIPAIYIFVILFGFILNFFVILFPLIGFE